MGFPKSEKISKITPLGERLLRAFAEGPTQTTDKKVIADKLGYKSDKAIYKIINEEQEMSFSALRHFREATQHSTDWLLDGDAVPDKDDYVSVRTLLMYGPWLTAVRELQEQYNSANGHDLSFHEFLGELVRRGYQSFFQDSADQIGDAIRNLVREELSSLQLDRAGREEKAESDDEFIARSIQEHDDPCRVAQEWYAWRGWPVQEFTVREFAGWDEWSLEKKIAQIKATRLRLIRHIKRNEILPPEDTDNSS